MKKGVYLSFLLVVNIFYSYVSLSPDWVYKLMGLKAKKVGNRWFRSEGVCRPLKPATPRTGLTSNQPPG